MIESSKSFKFMILCTQVQNKFVFSLIPRYKAHSYLQLYSAELTIKGHRWAKVSVRSTKMLMDFYKQNLLKLSIKLLGVYRENETVSLVSFLVYHRHVDRAVSQQSDNCHFKRGALISAFNVLPISEKNLLVYGNKGQQDLP